MARKFSAPGQLCVPMTSNLGGSTPISAASATSLGHFTKSMCPPQQYGFPPAPFGTQWSGTGGPAPQPLGQFQPVGTASLQNFNISNLQNSISNPPSSNLREDIMFVISLDNEFNVSRFNCLLSNCVFEPYDD